MARDLLKATSETWSLKLRKNTGWVRVFVTRVLRNTFGLKRDDVTRGLEKAE